VLFDGCRPLERLGIHMTDYWAEASSDGKLSVASTGATLLSIYSDSYLYRTHKLPVCDR